MTATVAALARQYRIATPVLNVGEWAWQSANLPGTGALSFRNENYFVNDWSAAFIGASLIEMQRDGVQTSIYTNPVTSRDETGFKASGLMSPKAPWANSNVYLLWHKLAGTVVRTSLSADPGIFAVASRTSHQIAVLVASLHNRAGARYGLTLQMPRKLANQKVRIWVVDRTHADAYDAGAAHARLGSTSRTLSTRAQLQFSLQSRAVVLVQASGA